MQKEKAESELRDFNFFTPKINKHSDVLDKNARRRTRVE
jgi:hypothetical protein